MRTKLELLGAGDSIDDVLAEYRRQTTHRVHRFRTRFIRLELEQVYELLHTQAVMASDALKNLEQESRPD